jgi:hypothetical protein
MQVVKPAYARIARKNLRQDTFVGLQRFVASN